MFVFSPKRLFFPLVCAIACVALFAGCDTGSGSSGGEPVTTATLKIVNNARVAMVALYIDPYTSDPESALGKNQLGTSLIASGTSDSVVSIPAGDYGIRYSFAGETGYTYYAKNGIQTKRTLVAGKTYTMTMCDGTFSDGSYSMKIESFE